MPRVTEEHREEMRQRICNAAMSCVARKGFAGLSMADIIAEAQLSAGAVYLYYKNKNELVLGVGRRVMNERLTWLNDEAQQAVPQAPPKAIARMATDLQEVSAWASLAVQVWGEAAHNVDFAAIVGEILSEAQKSLADYLGAWFRGGRDMSAVDADSRAQRLAPALLALVHGVILRIGVLGDGQAELLAPAVSELLEDL